MRLVKPTLTVGCITCLLIIGGASATPSTAKILAAAQTHPCDQPPPATVTIASNAPHKVQLCAQQSDAPEALLAVVDSQNYDLLPITERTGASATGLVLYETTLFLQVPRGSHTLTLRLYNRNVLTGQLQLGVAAGPFPFVAADDTPPAAAPKFLGIIR
jgi:hypothetical protein